MEELKKIIEEIIEIGRKKMFQLWKEVDDELFRTRDKGLIVNKWKKRS